MVQGYWLTGALVKTRYQHNPENNCIRPRLRANVNVSSLDLKSYIVFKNAEKKI